MCGVEFMIDKKDSKRILDNMGRKNDSKFGDVSAPDRFIFSFTSKYLMLSTMPHYPGPTRPRTLE